MWMMGYSDGVGEFNMPADSFNGRKLRPLIPRPLPSSTVNNNHNNSATPTPPCLTRIHATDFFSLNHHHHHLGSHFVDQNKREFNTPPVVVSSRWNPTPEQLRTLEELYRRGTRTPSAEQIQHITAQLRRYGKIEGKNVFYWFQNHKARERQKRRRQMELSSPDHEHHHNNVQDIEIFERKDSTGANRTTAAYEVEQTKLHNNNNNWPPSTNCSTLSAYEESGGMQIRGAKAGVAECRPPPPGGWIQLDDGELIQHRSRSVMERNATWQQMMQLSCPSHTHLSDHHHNLINSNISTSSTTASNTPAAARMDPKQVMMMSNSSNIHDLNIFIAPYKENVHGFGHGFDRLINTTVNNGEDGDQSQTLQLFPLRSTTGDGSIENNQDKANEVSLSSIDASLITPCQYFEFLPLKN
ncbi:hypothetical protein Ddye_003083 [Dipteronia dyeriana]|uniref:Homeobox domain-containing protein n=1 Tax=Dipteronia dyeriana TaxID=168575 RepID=A0AAE0CV55_9ROSI|nr:hypothetical protein Ddye_003083 [Dipteronia dyeriana]